jgi:hypothetical protein
MRLPYMDSHTGIVQVQQFQLTEIQRKPSSHPDQVILLVFSMFKFTYSPPPPHFNPQFELGAKYLESKWIG